MDLVTKIELLECYIRCDKSATNALREFKRRHNMFKDPFSSAIVYKLMEKFYETGTLHDKPRSGRPSLEHGSCR